MKRKLKSNQVKSNFILIRKTRNSVIDRNLKYVKANNVLNDLLMKFKNSPELRRKLKNPFNSCLSAEDLIKKLHGDENKLLGILIGYKFFKPLSKNWNKLVKKMLKLLMTRKKDEEDNNINNFHITLAGLESKLEMFQQTFNKLHQNEMNSDHNDSSQI